MNTRALLALLAVVMTGCWTSFDISPAQVPHVASGKVRDLRDAGREVGIEYEVWAHPQEDVVFMMAPRSDLAIAVPGWDEGREAARGLVRVLPAGKSVDQPSVDVTRITGPLGTFLIPNASIQRIEIQQFSPVKTAFVVTGSVLGTGAIVATLVVLVVLVAHAPRPRD